MWNPAELTYGAWLTHYQGANHTHFLQFELLTDPTTRREALTSALDFAGFGDANPVDVECAFPRADNRDTHRARSSDLVSATTAWKASLLEEVWAIVGDRAAPLGYTSSNWHSGEKVGPIDEAKIYASYAR